VFLQVGIVADSFANCNKSESVGLLQHCSIRAVLPSLPAWESVNSGDIFRVFEKGGRNIINLFPETGLPNVIGQIQRLEEPGRPDIRQSNRGPGTGARISVPVINLHKTRLNDPFTWFLGTNDQPGDYRSSGCASCQVVYANDRDRADGNYLDYISAEQAFMAVQMLVIELDDPYLEDQLDRIADTLNNDERYRPSRFAAMLAALAEPEPEAEDIDEQDE